MSFSFQLGGLLLADSDHLLEAVVSKLVYTSGVKFYRSCQEAKDFLDQLRPRWILPGSTIDFYINKDDNQFIRKLIFRTREQVRQRVIGRDEDLEFLRVDALHYVGHCPPIFLKKHIIPTLTALNSVKLFSIGTLDVQGLDILFPEEKPARIKKNIEKLEIVLQDDGAQVLGSSGTRIFDVCRGKKRVRLNCLFRIAESRKLDMLNAFLEGWIMGENVDRLEELLIPGGSGACRGQWGDLEEISRKIQNLAESVMETGEEEYEIRRTPTWSGKDSLTMKRSGYGVILLF